MSEGDPLESLIQNEFGKPAQELKNGQLMLSSAISSTITTLTMTPLDVVKIRLQAQQKPFKKGSAFVYNNGLMDCLCICSHCNENPAAKKLLPSEPWYGRPSNFNGTWDALLKITRNEGLIGLWSGLSPTLLISIPITIVYFPTYDRLKYMMGYKENDSSTMFIPSLAGSMARNGLLIFYCGEFRNYPIVSAIVVLFNPLELFRTKMQSELLTYRQLNEAVRFSIRNHGISFAMRGVGPAFLRDVPFSAFYWFIYEYIKAKQLRETGNAEPRFIVSFLSGAISGSVAALLTLPFDVIKTHRQIELGEALGKGEMKFNSTWKMITQLYKTNGFTALFAGAVPRLIKVAPSCAIMISTYELGKSFFRRRNALQKLDMIK